jgi:hypothetical protein
MPKGECVDGKEEDLDGENPDEWKSEDQCVNQESLHRFSSRHQNWK